MTPVDQTQSSGKYTVTDVPMSQIFHDWRFNCRGRIIPMDVIDLAKDVAARGLDQPIVVRPWSDPANPAIKYKIVAGHRRHMAFQVNEAKEIPCFIRPDLDDLAAHMLNFRENLHRVDLNIKQEAHALKYFLDYKKEGTERCLFTEVELAQIFGQSRGWVQNRKDLLKLPDDIQNEAAAGILSSDNIKLLARIKSKEEQYELVRRIKERKLKGEKISLKPSIKRVNDVLRPSEREKAEIDEMLDLLYDVVGPGLAMRCLAWAAGNISTSELYATVEQYCKDEGLPFKMPKFVTDAITGVRSNEKVNLT